MVLIFTNKEDAHPNPVIDLLTERGVPFFRLNTECLLTDYAFSWKADGSGCDLEILDKTNGARLIGSEITAVWDRRPERPKSLPIENTEKINRHNLQEALGFLRFLRDSLVCIPSIGSIGRDRIASSKILQQRLARECGFVFPDTVFGNTKDAIATMAKRHGRVCLKSIEGYDIWDEENGLDYVFFTQTLDSSALHDIPEDAFIQTVYFVQEYVPKDYELRVTVVGEEVFPAKILSQGLPEDKGKIDWRQGYDSGLIVQETVLPAEIRERCVRLVRALGLNFGCIDLIVRPDGEYVFLECNPNGQWLWVELMTGMKISESIADFLSNPSSGGMTDLMK